MVGSTLRKIRYRIETLSSPDGRYRVVCGRTGTSPVPVIGQRFPDRAAAEEAAETAATYRSVLRRWDPRAPWYDFITCEVSPSSASGPARADARASTSGGSTLTAFCHDAAAAVFQTLSARGHGGVERAIVDAYCERADEVADPDDLCVHLLGTLAHEIDARLAPAERRALVRDAASHLGAVDAEPAPLDAAFRRLQTVELVDEYTVRQTGDDERSWTVTVGQYALSDRDGRLPTLPIGLDLCRRLSGPGPSLSGVDRLDAHTWRFDVTAAGHGPEPGLVGAPVGAE